MLMFDVVTGILLQLGYFVAINNAVACQALSTH